jgi:hypothetical protein
MVLLAVSILWWISGGSSSAGAVQESQEKARSSSRESWSSILPSPARKSKKVRKSSKCPRRPRHNRSTHTRLVFPRRGLNELFSRFDMLAPADAFTALLLEGELRAASAFRLGAMRRLRMATLLLLVLRTVREQSLSEPEGTISPIYPNPRKEVCALVRGEAHSLALSLSRSLSHACVRACVCFLSLTLSLFLISSPLSLSLSLSLSLFSHSSSSISLEGDERRGKRRSREERERMGREETGEKRGERDARGAKGEMTRATEKWGARKGEGGERRGEGQTRKGWVQGEQPRIIGPVAVAAACGSVCKVSACIGES